MIWILMMLRLCTESRNNATKCINQSLAVVGEQIGLSFTLSMHLARHSFAVFALNKGLSMSVVAVVCSVMEARMSPKRFMPNFCPKRCRRKWLV